MSSQKLNKKDVIGFWRLKESGIYKNKIKVKKNFDNCLLMRNYTLRDDGNALYSHVEGAVGNCIPYEPRLSLWRIVDNRIQFYIDEQKVIEEVVVVLNEDKTITFSSYIPKRIKVDGDADAEQAMNMVHYDILEKF